MNVCNMTAVHEAWRQGRSLTVHGWIYSIANGLLRDLGVCISSEAELKALEGN
jgi:carbonic anhydrase